MTKVVNLYKEPYDVYIGRKGKGQDGYFGNPYKTVEEYETYFYSRITDDEEFRNRVHELKGLTLGCFCKPKKCHGDVIVNYLNNLL